MPLRLLLRLCRLLRLRRRLRRLQREVKLLRPAKGPLKEPSEGVIKEPLEAPLPPTDLAVRSRAACRLQ